MDLSFLDVLLPKPTVEAVARDVRELAIAVNELKAGQAEMVKALQAVNQSLAKLILQKSQEPDEMTNAQRAALIGLPPSMADLVDWDQIRRR